MLDFLSSIFGLAALGALVFATAYGIIWLREYQLDRQANRFNLLHRFNPDERGNYPAFFDPRSHNFGTFTPGNKAIPEQLLFVHGMTKPVQDTRPIVLNSSGAPRLSSEDVAGLLEVKGAPVQSEIEPGIELEQTLEQAEHAPKAMTLEEIGEALRQAKLAGLGKTRALEQITGKKRGGGPDYKLWSNFWDTL